MIGDVTVNIAVEVEHVIVVRLDHEVFERGDRRFGNGGKFLNLVIVLVPGICNDSIGNRRGVVPVGGD